MHINTCTICNQMAERKKKAVGNTDQIIKSCLLCRHDFCARHESESDGVCEVNHETYYAKHRLAVENIYPSLEERQKALEKKKTTESKDGGGEASGTSNKGRGGASAAPGAGQGST